MNADSFARDLLKQGKCMSLSEGRRQFRLMTKQPPTCCPCQICGKCCCHLVKDVKNNEDRCVNKEEFGICDCHN